MVYPFRSVYDRDEEIRQLEVTVTGSGLKPPAVVAWSRLLVGVLVAGGVVGHRCYDVPPVSHRLPKV